MAARLDNNKKDGIPVPAQVVRAAGYDVQGPAPFSAKQECIAGELARAVGFHLLLRENAVREYGLAHPSPSGSCHDEWRRMLQAEPLCVLLGRMFSETDQGRELRRQMPFAGFLTKAERVHALDMAAKRKP
jgi:hypothetical protein